MDPLLRIVDLHKKFGELEVLRRRQPGRGARREGLDHRPQRLGQDDASALHQLSREADRRSHLHRRQADRREAGQRRLRPSERSRAGQGTPGNRLRLPALQSVSASDRARQRHHRAAKGAGPVARGGRSSAAGEMLEKVGLGHKIDRISRAAFRRPAAARGHRPRARHAAEAHAVRRGDLGARSRAYRRGAARHAPACRGRAHHGDRDARDPVRRRSLRPRRLHGPRQDRRAGPARARCSSSRSCRAPANSSSTSRSAEAATLMGFFQVMEQGLVFPAPPCWAAGRRRSPLRSARSSSRWSSA